MPPYFSLLLIIIIAGLEDRSQVKLFNYDYELATRVAFFQMFVVPS